MKGGYNFMKKSIIGSLSFIIAGIFISNGNGNEHLFNILEAVLDIGIVIIEFIVKLLAQIVEFLL
jgi:hypothetical protein